MPAALSIDLRTPARQARAAAVARAFVRRAVATLLPGEEAEISVWLCGDRTIRSLNRRFRGVDRATDVLSFPAAEGVPGLRALGDLIVSLDTSRRRARELGIPFEDELRRYLAHGLLHLLGHDHERPAEAKRMAALERRLVSAIGLTERSDPASAPARSSSARPAPARASPRARGRGRRRS